MPETPHAAFPEPRLAPTPHRGSDQWAWAVLWLAGFFLIVAGAKFWIISVYGAEVPCWDQWVEARRLFQPWLEGKLTWSDLFRAHNEHRIFFTRALDLMELRLNGQWDPILQMFVNAVIHAAFGCGLGFLFWRFFGRRHAGLIVLSLLPFFVLPFGAENTVHGFQSQMYFLGIFSVAAIAGLGFGQPMGALWFGGLASALMAIVTMGSGLLAAMAVAGLVALRAVKRRALPRGQVVTLVSALAIIALGLAVNVTAPQDAQYQAKTAHKFLTCLLETLAWPLSRPPAVAIVVGLPWMLLFVRYWQRGFRNERAAEFVLTFGFWGGLKVVALAYGRAAIIHSSRYMDTVCVPSMAALASLFVLADNLDFPQVSRGFKTALAVLWTGLLIGGMGGDLRPAFSYLHWTSKWSVTETENVRAFIATGDATWIQGIYDFDSVTNLLRQPELLSIMPPDTRRPLRVEPAAGTDCGFVADGYPPALPKQAFTHVWGDYATNGSAPTGRFISQEISPSLPTLLLHLGCGPEADGLSASLVEASGHATELHWKQRNAWQTLIVNSPGKPFHLEIQNTNPGTWVAVGEIIEAGRFYRLTRFFLHHAAAVGTAGLLCCLWATVASRPRAGGRARVGPGGPG